MLRNFLHMIQIKHPDFPGVTHPSAARFVISGFVISRLVISCLVISCLVISRHASRSGKRKVRCHCGQAFICTDRSFRIPFPNDFNLRIRAFLKPFQQNQIRLREQADELLLCRMFLLFYHHIFRR